MDISQESVVEQQEQLLQEFLHSNTTPELLKEITISPNKSKTSFHGALDKTLEDKTQQGKPGVTHSIPKEKGKALHSPKVKILSDIRLDWPNTVFCSKPAENTKK